MTTTTTTPIATPTPELVRRALGRRRFATLATVSEAGRPHAAGVLYALADDGLWISTNRSSRKARNVAATGRAGIVVPVRRLPVGPPSSIQFQAVARVVDVDDVRGRATELQAVTGHGELDLPDGCFLHVELPARVHTYGLGLSLVRLLRDPLAAAGVVVLG